MKKRDELLGLIKDDPLGLLKSSTSSNNVSEENAILISYFEEIQSFIEEHGREPKSDISNINEFKLFSRLKAIRSDPKKVKVLSKYDFNNLLKGSDIKEISVDDIIADDSFGLLNADVSDDIFKLKHVKSSDRIKPDFLSRRKVCKDFQKYKDMFATLHDELASKKRRLIKYVPSDLNVGKFYALNGILLLFKEIEGKSSNYIFNSGERERFDGRTLCIFDNGTQSDMLFRSLDKAMQLDGYSISDIVPPIADEISQSENDVLNGYIYVLRSKNPEVQNIKDLFKIGHTTGTVAERIRNAKSQATYLFSEVDIVTTYRCLNIQSYNLEQTIHDFFSAVKLDIELLDSDRNIYKPREWFNVSLDVIEDVIKLILQNELSEYVYDPAVNQIIKRYNIQKDENISLAAEDNLGYKQKNKKKRNK